MIDYQAAAATYDHTRRHSEAVIDRFAAGFDIRTEHCVLDFGCGTGNYLARIHQRFGCRVVGVEPAQAMRAQAMAKLPVDAVLEGNHQHIPVPGQSIDFAYMTDVIHHVPDLPALFQELHRVLKPGGNVCVVTESHAQIDGRFYNRYFPSVAGIEKRRYPDLPEIVAAARSQGLPALRTEVLPTGARRVDEDFLRNVAEKNWSMFRLLPEDEFSGGLAALRRDAGQTFASASAGTTLLWFSGVPTPAPATCPTGVLPPAHP